jgi:hypothetical protein
MKRKNSEISVIKDCLTNEKDKLLTEKDLV